MLSIELIFRYRSYDIKIHKISVSKIILFCFQKHLHLQKAQHGSQTDYKITDSNDLTCHLSLTVRRDVQENDEEAVRVKEQSILELGTLLAKTGQAAGTVKTLVLTLCLWLLFFGQ